LLSGAAPIENAFIIKQLPVRGNLQWYELEPKREQSEFKRLRVAFLNGVLHTIELEDVFNQRTRLQFKNPQRNTRIDPSLLQFKPPPGVDVVGDAP
jgi:outer membrane lipoprotein carrier protein